MSQAPQQPQRHRVLLCPVLCGVCIIVIYYYGESTVWTSSPMKLLFFRRASRGFSSHMLFKESLPSIRCQCFLSIGPIPAEVLLYALMKGSFLVFLWLSIFDMYNNFFWESFDTLAYSVSISLDPPKYEVAFQSIEIVN